MTDRRVAVLGASSLVGATLLGRLSAAGWDVLAVSRSRRESGSPEARWITAAELPSEARSGRIGYWISLAPVWVLAEYFDAMAAAGAARVVALSSTSRFSKRDSSSSAERELVAGLAAGEGALKAWAERAGIAWVVLRPTMIYGCGRDRNVREIAHFVRRFRVFPLLGSGNGLRQPIHADDVAAACVAALEAPAAANRAYDICGGETLPYLEMVARIFAAVGRRPAFVRVPLSAFRAAILLARVLPRYRGWTTSMAERMSRDLAFDGSDAVRDLGITPRRFQLSAEDLSV